MAILCLPCDLYLVKDEVFSHLFSDAGYGKVCFDLKGFDVKNFVFVILIGASCTLASAQEVVTYKDFIRKDVKCDNPSGNEIKEWVKISAPIGKFFAKDSIKIIEEQGSRSYTNAADASGCFVRNYQLDQIFVQTKSGMKFPVSVVRGFDVYVHADCGSGEAVTAHHMANNENISMYCSAIATVYPLPDLN